MTENPINILLITSLILIGSFFSQGSPAQDPSSIEWKVNRPIFTASGHEAFDNASVKDPSIVFYEGNWHLFYTAFSKENNLQIGYVRAPELSGLQDSQRHMLVFRNEENLAGKYAAPQVFYFEPQKKWYLVFQGYWNNVQPLFSTNNNIEDPSAWTQPEELMPKFEENAWVDFYVICDNEYAYLTYSRDYRSVYAVKTRIDRFPEGFDYENPVMLIDDPRVEFGEAAHIYWAKGLNEYHMIYETSEWSKSKIRSYSLYHSQSIDGPWEIKIADYASKSNLDRHPANNGWPEEVSHGEMIRTNYNQSMEYDPVNVRFLMQGIVSSERGKDYSPEKYWMLPWKLGILETTIKND